MDIKALDFLRRKIFGGGMNDLSVINAHCEALRQRARHLTIAGSSANVRKHAEVLHNKANEWEELTERLAVQIKKNPNALGVAAVDYLMYAGYVTLSDHWLRMEEVSSKMYHDEGSDKGFHEAKIKVCVDDLLSQCYAAAAANATSIRYLCWHHVVCNMRRWLRLFSATCFLAQRD
jgi:hypothetical protein